MLDGAICKDPSPGGLPGEACVTVACAADGRYALPLAVMLRSAGEQLAASTWLRACVLDDGLTPEDRGRIELSLPPRVCIEWCVPQRILPSLPLWGRMTATTYQKLMLGDWLPRDVDRVLWLDADLLVLDDPGRLAHVPDPGIVAAAVIDPRVPRLASRFGVAGWEVLGMNPDAPYFNAGVMAINLAHWRRENVGGRCLAYLERFADGVSFWDQEALNAVLCQGLWQPLPVRWNVHPSLAPIPGSPAPPHPAVIHFSGRLKPWTHRGSDAWSRQFYAVVDRTDWAGTRPVHRLSTDLARCWERSRLRPWFYPLESWGTLLHRHLTVRRSR
ncbi:hypothetical protein KBZ18_05090 [Synechococcus sp. Cruz-9H2]|uniref:glycosyltransferase family 8 protein n=1 Tax=unclassified Synechococcus TaxID=2626047 RepID=UPI0020CCED4A|nr:MULTISPECIES: glycosyltransferase [unclassified Synechococcus]MCP9818864.1 hypothetical protein [Synechococcus sp. Cruz-9H2]MCP9843367.1 hypothetical protein [Synechococcus sp. Edmonson 11F2]MCP9855250.1 hypothetical protein [Synechococcus sp. Cruz-9C9]MCP9862777.1 hypothetical protein [Synechococcus sp. Cruz-7E5]MCP9869774.1 hypothetical protein [Synechococcus sp. Cruz-7B9]